MNCKKCGAPLAENDQFCKNCGAAVNEVNAQNNVEVSQPAFIQNDINEVQQSMSNMSNQPINNVQQPMNNMVNQPNNNIQQPMNNMVNQPMNNMVNQPINNFQQPMNNYGNGYTQQPMYNTPVKSNNTKFVFIGIGIAVMIAIAAVLFLVLGVNNNYSENSNSNYTVKFKDFTFKIPSDLVYESKTDGIIIGDEAGTWQTSISVLDGSFNQMLSNKNKLASTFEQLGYNSSTALEKNIGGVNFITLEISKAGDNALLSYSKANSMYIFGTTSYNLDNEFDYDTLKTVSKILKNAEFNTETNNISTYENIDMSAISELAQ